MKGRSSGCKKFCHIKSHMFAFGDRPNLELGTCESAVCIRIESRSFAGPYLKWLWIMGRWNKTQSVSMFMCIVHTECRQRFLGFFKVCLLLSVISMSSVCLCVCLEHEQLAGHCCSSWRRGLHSTVVHAHLQTVWRQYWLPLPCTTTHGLAKLPGILAYEFSDILFAVVFVTK